MLVLLMGGIYDVRRWDAFMWHDILTKFNKDWYRCSSNIVTISINALPGNSSVNTVQHEQ
jgi:hypothetical protein